MTLVRSAKSPNPSIEQTATGKPMQKDAMPKPTKAPASAKKKPAIGAKAPVQTNGKDSIVHTAWNAWKRGDRMLLLQIWDCYLNVGIPPELHHILRRFIEYASIAPPVTKRKPGRPPRTTRYHDDAQRGAIVRNVSWLLTIKSGMTIEHARELTADHYGISASLVKQYCLAAARKPR